MHKRVISIGVDRIIDQKNNTDKEKDEGMRWNRMLMVFKKRGWFIPVDLAVLNRGLNHQYFKMEFVWTVVHDISFSL